MIFVLYLQTIRGKWIIITRRRVIKTDYLSSRTVERKLNININLKSHICSREIALCNIMKMYGPFSIDYTV